MGMKVFIIPFYDDNPYQRNLADSLRVNGVEIIFVKYVANRLFPILGSVIANGMPDIIHLHWTDIFLLGKTRTFSIIKSLLFVFELCLLKILGIRLVWTVHNLFNHEKRHPGLEKYFHRICCIVLYDRIIVLSSFTIRAIIQAYQLPERLRSKMVIVPHGHYINNYRNQISKNQARYKLDIPDDKIVFLYFGQIRSYKGIFHLIDEFNKLPDPNALLLIAGKSKPDSFKHEIENLCEKYNQIRTYLNFIPDDEIEIYFNAADVVVLPFQEILNSGSLILAMSFGKPVICPHLGSTPEIIDEKGAFLYNPNDKKGLFNALNQAFRHDLISMGQRNYNNIKFFEWPTIAKQTYAVYEQSTNKFPEPIRE